MTIRSFRIPRDGRRPRGFTLVELVVVIGIIIALLSLVLAVSTLLIQQNEARQLESAFANLETAILEYEQAVGRRMTFQAYREPVGAYDIPQNPQFGITGLEGQYNAGGSSQISNTGCNWTCTSNADQHGWEKYIVQLMSLLTRTQSAEDIIARLDPALFVPVRLANGQPLPNNQTLTSLVDPWGAAVAVVMPGRLWKDSDGDGNAGNGEFPRDADGTIRTKFEQKAGICRNGKILFVSAGPDGDLGSRDCAGGNSPRYEASLDNIYSYEPGNP
jgi:type II secretory pathway pseudopilin PulG